MNKQIPTSIKLCVTDDCCCACKYCFVKQNPVYMSYQVAKDSVDMLARNIKEKRIEENNETFKGIVTWFGGEPTIMWDELIVPITYYIEKTYPGYFHCDMTTNGMLLTRERIDFLEEHNINILFSMDGNEITQNHNRPLKNGEDGFKKLDSEVIDYLLEKMPRTGYRMTIQPEMVNYIFDNYIYARAKGFQRIVMVPNERTAWTDNDYLILERELKKIYLLIAEDFKNEVIPTNFLFMIDKSIRKILSHDLKIMLGIPFKLEQTRGISRCGVSSISAAIHYNGDMYTCQEQNSHFDKFFKIGNIYTGIDYEKCEKLNHKYIDYKLLNNQCDNCELKNFSCNLYCPSVSYDLFKDFNTNSNCRCAWRKILIKLTTQLITHLSASTSASFKQYIMLITREEAEKLGYVDSNNY